VRFDSNRTDASAIAKAISDSGYQATPESDHVSPIEHEEHRLMHQAEHAKAWLRRAIVGIALWLPVELTHWILALTGHPHAAAERSAAAGLSGISWLDWLSLLTSTITILYVGW